MRQDLDAAKATLDVYRTHDVSGHLAAIGELLNRFASDKIDIVLLKGAALAPTLYRELALRPFADIDLLVGENQIDIAKQILTGAGYEIAPELLSEKFNRKYHVNLPFVRSGPKPVHIELHWKLSDPFSEIAFDHAGLFARAQRTKIAERPAQVLTIEDELIYLATHLDNHGYLNRTAVNRAHSSEFVFDELSGDRLIWFTDLHEIISAGGLSWETILDRARAANASNTLAVTLRLLRALLGTEISTGILDQLPLRNVRWPERKLAAYVLSLVDLPEKRSRSRELFRRKFLTTRKGFELRLVRLIDVWEYVFPARSDLQKPYLVHVLGAMSRCINMLTELQLRRVSRFLRSRDVT